jgi:RHS repeat-associated protein
VNSYKYDPFGGKVSATGTVVNPWRYVGQYLDTETGMYHLGARYYDPTIGRFTQQDPQSGQLMSPLTFNRYLYSGDNPCNGKDPSGRDVWSCISSAVEGFYGTVLVAAGGGLFLAGTAVDPEILGWELP